MSWCRGDYALCGGLQEHMFNGIETLSSGSFLNRKTTAKRATLHEEREQVGQCDSLQIVWRRETERACAYGLNPSIIVSELTLDKLAITYY